MRRGAEGGRRKLGRGGGAVEGKTENEGEESGLRGYRWQSGCSGYNEFPPLLCSAFEVSLLPLPCYLYLSISLSFRSFPSHVLPFTLITVEIVR